MINWPQVFKVPNYILNVNKNKYFYIMKLFIKMFIYKADLPPFFSGEFLFFKSNISAQQVLNIIIGNLIFIEMAKL